MTLRSPLERMTLRCVIPSAFAFSSIQAFNCCNAVGRGRVMPSHTLADARPARTRTTTIRISDFRGAFILILIELMTTRLVGEMFRRRGTVYFLRRVL